MKILFIIAIAAALTSCGGTFIFPSPIGPVSYTTPQLIKPPVVVPVK